MKKGFTIIELLVSVTILSLLVGATIASYSQYYRRQTLVTAGQTMKNILREAQSRAFTGEVDCSVCNCTPSGASLSGWYVDFTAKQIYGKCGTATFSPKPFDLSSSAVVVPYIASNGILFRPIPPGGVSETARICISTSEMPDMFYRIDVTSTGSISDAEMLEATCTP